MWRTIGVLALLVLTSCFLWMKWKHDEPRRYSLDSLKVLFNALDSTDSGSLFNVIIVPQAMVGRTSPEQREFLTKALRDEISAEGLAVLKRDGIFGPLTDLFPSEAAGWAEQAGVKAEDCVAFKLQRDGLRAEVVLVREGNDYRVVRCNNVKQMAMTGRHS